MKRALFRNIGRWGVVFLVLVTYGCATAPPKPTPEKVPEKAPEKVPEKVTLPPFPQRYLDLAEGYEKTGELHRALICWEVIQGLQPGNEEAAKKIADLKARTMSLADRHFKQGLVHFKNNAVQAARREFALALYYNPDHAEAMTYLKVKLNEEDYTLYEVKPGDTLREIAKKVYNDPQKDFLIAYINNLGKDPKLEPKTVLMLPILDASQPKASAEMKEMPMDPKEIAAEVKDSKEAVEPRESKEAKEGRETREMMAKAELQFKTNKFRETAVITEDILSIDPTNKQARDLKNASYYQMGKALTTQKKYGEALDQFARVEPGFRDVSDLIVTARRQLAEVHYVKGIKFYTEEKLDQAVQEWEEALKLNPQHPKAKGDIENAQKLLQKLKEIK